MIGRSAIALCLLGLSVSMAAEAPEVPAPPLFPQLQAETFEGALILKGQSQLLQDISGLEDLERIRQLFKMLETKEALARLLKLTESAEGVRIFIGAESELFALAGCSIVIAPYSNTQQQIVGAIGVIGPTRIDYARIIPMVDYTAKVISRMVG